MLKGRTVTLRTVMERDLNQLVALLGDIDSQGDYLPTMMESESRLRASWNENGLVSETFERYLITDHADNLLGTVWVFKSVPYYDAVEVGYQIFSPSSRGKGLASEALTLLTDYVFESRQVNRVEVRVATGNKASQRVALKSGYTLEGTNREAAFSKGRLFDMHLYAVLRREWQSKRINQ